MSFVDSIKTCLKKYADFTGRARRSEFWWFAVATFLACTILTSITVGSALFSAAASFDLEEIASLLGSLALVGLFSLALIIPNLAVGVRRMHDIDKPGIYILIAFIPLVGLYILYLATIEGTKGPNQYGPDPKA